LSVFGLGLVLGNTGFILSIAMYYTVWIVPLSSYNTAFIR